MVIEVAHSLPQLSFECFHDGNDTTPLDRLFPVLNPPLKIIFPFYPVGVYCDNISHLREP